ncbi:TolB family protein [Rhodanobacter sp. Col0626]|uniref:TolB family protein n=1 Tax=Rhodanobacter sp. Col0626 TaxID=3415679 RepID=UPI003CF98274
MSPRHFVLAACIAITFAAVPAARAASTGELLGPGVISTGLQETSAALSPDGQTLYFMRSDFAEADDTIMVSRRSGGFWSMPQVATFSGRWHDSEPTLAPNGNRLYFVSNRPVRAGAAPLMAEMSGHPFPGTNLWYVERLARGWSAPVHVEGALNDGAMIYNPSVAANGDIYFSAHRADSGKAYQIYVAHPQGDGYAAPVRQELGDIGVNRMDPAVDPAGRFLLYAGNEGDALGSADIYIVFRQPDGRWSKPEHLGGDVNSRMLENAPSLGPAFGELYVSSGRRDEMHFPKSRDDADSLRRRLQSPLNGSRNLWRFDISDVLRAHDIAR